MGNKATTVKEQILLLKSRGMHIDYEEEKAEELLLDIGYYRLGFYWNPFEIDDKHAFGSDSKLSDAISLYYLDVDLRNILLKYLNRIEINFKTFLIYHVSNCYKDSPTWFIDPKIVSTQFTQTINNYYDDDFKNKNKVIKNHHYKYINDKYAPAWKTLEFFTFGTILKIFISLKDERLKSQIAELYGVNTVKKFENHLRIITHIRNICAHGGIIFDMRTSIGISHIPDLELNPNDRNSLNAVIKLILFYLGKISKSRKNELLGLITKLMDNHKDNDKLKGIIETKIGYKFH